MRLDAFSQFTGNNPESLQGGDWIKKVNDIREAEHCIATCKGKVERFDAIWRPWKDYMSDPDHATSSLDLALLELVEPTLRSHLGNGNNIN